MDSRALDELSRLVEASELDADATELAPLVQASVSGVAAGDSGRSVQEVRDLAAEFTSRGLLDERIVADAFLGDSIAALQAPSMADPDRVAGRIGGIAQHHAAEVDAEATQGVYDAAGASPWLVTPLQENLLIVLAVAVSDAGGEQPIPYSAEQIYELARGHSINFGIATWVGRLAASAEEAFPAVEPTARASGFPVGLAAALRTLANRLGANSALALAQLHYDRYGLEEPPSKSFLRALAACDPDPDAVADWIVQLFSNASNRKQRNGAMRAWSGLDPRDDGARKRLLMEVLMPLLSDSKDSLKLALSNIELASDPPHGTKTKVLKAIREAGRKRKMKKATERAIEGAGLDQARLSIKDKLTPEDTSLD